MAKELDMKVVAEGIECTQQLDMLQDTGCDMVQGFIYAKPCSEEDSIIGWKQNKAAAAEIYPKEIKRDFYSMELCCNLLIRLQC